MINGLCCGELFHSDLSSDDNYCLMANENMIPGPGGGGSRDLSHSRRILYYSSVQDLPGKRRVEALRFRI